MIGVAAGEDLSFRFQAAKGTGMDDTVAIALKVVAVGMLRLEMTASAGVFDAHRIVGEHEVSLAVETEPAPSQRASTRMPMVGRCGDAASRVSTGELLRTFFFGGQLHLRGI